MADWIKIRNEYINGNISYRKLADKHGVSFKTLQDKAIKEKWFNKRKKQREKIGEKIGQKTAEKLAEKEANRLMRISNAADKLLKKLEIAIEQTDLYIQKTKVSTPTLTKDENTGKIVEVKTDEEQLSVVKLDRIDRAGLKQITSALKDLKDIQFSQGQQDDEPQNPVININIRPAQPMDEIGDDEGGDE